MIDLIKSNLRRRIQDKKVPVIPLILALILHLIVFMAIKEFKQKPVDVPLKEPTVFEPVIFIQPEITLKPEKVIRGENSFKVQSRPIPHAVPDPQLDTEEIQVLERYIMDNEIQYHKKVGEIILPMLIKKYIPEYPQIAREMGLEGEVKVRCTLDSNGKVVRAALFPNGSSGADILDGVALNAASMCIFTPAKQGDIRIDSVDVEVTYRFTLINSEIF